MNILILNWRDPKNPLSGGAEIVTMQHAKAWVKTGHSVDWLAMKFSNSMGKEEINGVNIYRKGNSITVFLCAYFHYMFSGIKYDLVIDEIHGIPFFTPLYVRKPKIAFIHEIAGEIWDYMYPFPLNIIGKTLESFYFLFYKKVTFWTDSNSTINELVAKGIKRDKCVAIACPADTKPLDVIPKKEDKPTFIFVSRLVKMKGVEDVIRAFALIKKENDKAVLWIVGDGVKEYVESLKLLASNLNINKNIVFYGRVDESKKTNLLKNAHILLHASVKEGWGLVVIEAASQATPSVVYNVSGLRDSVLNNITGLLVNKNNPQELASVSLSLYTNKKLYRKLQINALLYAKGLTWKIITKQSINLINTV